MQKPVDNARVARLASEPASDRRESVAAALRRAREKHGQDVRSVAQVLRIRQAYLEALEAGAFDKLPGAAYAIGFLRTYASYLGLDANTIVDRFKEEVQGPQRRTELVFPEPVAEGRIPGGAVILISVVLLSLAYGGWFYLSNQGRSVADLIPALPEQIQTLIDGDRNRPPSAEEAAPVIVADAPAAPVVAEVPDTKTPPKAEPAVASLAATAQDKAAASEPEPSTQVAVAAPPAAPIEAAPPVQVTAAIQEVPPVQASPPAERAQVAALPVDSEPRDSASDVYTGPPIDPGPAPELAALNLSDAPVPATTATETQAEPSLQQTVVIPAPPPAIPAPPAAPLSFAQPGERAPQNFGESNDSARIVLRALQDSWVQIRDSQDALLLTRVLRSGDTYRVPDQAGLTLLTGNAGGIQMDVDGVTLPPLGPIGAVRRQIALDPALLLRGGQQ